MSSPPKANPFQAKIRKLYLKLFRSVKTDEAKLNVAKAFGTFAMQNYTGHFREPEIETFLSDYSKQHFRITEKFKPFDEKVLIHIITKTFEIGGHSRFLENLLQLDKTHTHHLIISDQGETQPRENIYTLIKQQKGTITHLEGSIDDKAKRLIETVAVLGGKIMLHHHPNDIIPSISLPSLKDEYPIFFFNHSDHTYSFGFELNPVVINIREEAARITYHWRHCEKNTVLPLPIIKPEIKLSREEVFAKCGLNPDLKLGLCIAGMHKLIPGAEYNFFRTMKMALNENDNLQVAVVGVTPEKIQELHLEEYEHPRFYFLGTITDPSELQAHADLAIDPIPMGSYTALLETCWYGAIPVVSYNSIELFDLTKDLSFQSKFNISPDETTYLAEIKKAVNSENFEKKKKISSSTFNYHSGEEWNKIYLNVYNNEFYLSSINDPSDTIAGAFLEDDQSKPLFNLSRIISSVKKELNLKEKIEISVSLLNSTLNRNDKKAIVKALYSRDN